MSAQPQAFLGAAANDQDPQETKEWLDALSAVIDREGAGHAVLTVVTDRGDYVLDNQDEAILPWTHTGYRFVKRQSMHDPNVWALIGASARDPVATAAR